MEASPVRADVLVIGGGVVGLACAIDLQAAGLRTMLIAPESIEAASWGNAGHIAIEQVEPLASAATIRSVHRRLFWRGGALSLPIRDIAAWLPFSLRLLRASAPRRFAAGKVALSALLVHAMPAWRRLVTEIDAPELLLEDGHFVAWGSARSAESGRARWAATDTGGATFADASDADLASIRAHVGAGIAGAIRFTGSGQITDLPALATALSARFAVLGGERAIGQAMGIAREGDGIAVTLAGGGTVRAPKVVVAAGAASARLLAPLGLRVPIIAERGYHIQSATSDWPASLPPVAFEDRSIIVTRFHGGLRAASFVEFGRQARAPDPAKWRRLRAHVRALGLNFPEPVTQWVGARPTLPDYLPAIGRWEAMPGLVYAFGHQHLGLTLAAVTGEAVRALVIGEAPPLDLAPFDLARFQ